MVGAPNYEGARAMSNDSMTAAKRAKNDEFYTQFNDIQKEVNAYREYDADVFRGKTILLPCDDAEWSEFVQFFLLNFDRYGLKRLIGTSYNRDGRGKKFDVSRQVLRAELEYEELEGNGDFRSDEVTRLRDESDMVITNPPFSLFREFVGWVKEKQFLILGSINAVTYKEVFPLIKGGKMWAGRTFNQVMIFRQPAPLEDRKMPGIAWYTNIMHGRRNEAMELMTMADNLRYNKRLAGTDAYKRYDNFDAIEVPFSRAIPSDYDGCMGVPISYLGVHNPDQFEIVGYIANNDSTLSLRKSNKASYTAPFIDGRRLYARIIIRHRR